MEKEDKAWLVSIQENKGFSNGSLYRIIPCWTLWVSFSNRNIHNDITYGHIP